MVLFGPSIQGGAEKFSPDQEEVRFEVVSKVHDFFSTSLYISNFFLKHYILI